MGGGTGETITRPQAPDNTGRMLSLFVLSLVAAPVYHWAPGEEGVRCVDDTGPVLPQDIQFNCRSFENNDRLPLSEVGPAKADFLPHPGPPCRSLFLEATSSPPAINPSLSPRSAHLPEPTLHISYCTPLRH